MPTDEQHPTSFRFTDGELAALDELAQLLYDALDGEVAVTRKVAVVIAVRRELARMRGAVVRDERRTSAGRRWRCALCGQAIDWSHFKRHLSTVHREHDKVIVDREWVAFVEHTGQAPRRAPREG